MLAALETVLPALLQGVLQNLIPQVVSQDPTLAGLIPQLSDTEHLDKAVKELTVSVQNNGRCIAVKHILTSSLCECRQSWHL